ERVCDPQHGQPQQPQQLLHLERLYEHREVPESLRQLLSVFLRISGHDRHSLMWIDLMDLGHQLNTILDLRSRYKAIITEHERKRALVLVHIHSVVSGETLFDLNPPRPQPGADTEEYRIIVVHDQYFHSSSAKRIWSAFHAVTTLGRLKLGGGNVLARISYRNSLKRAFNPTEPASIGSTDNGCPYLFPCSSAASVPT